MFAALRKLLRLNKPAPEIDPSRAILESLGCDEDGRGTHWEISRYKTPKELLQFCIAASEIHAMFVHIQGRQKYVDPLQVSRLYGKLKILRGRGESGGVCFFYLAKALRLLGNPAAFELLDDFELDDLFLLGYIACVRDVRSMVYNCKFLEAEACKKFRHDAEMSITQLADYRDKRRRQEVQKVA